MGPLRRAGRRYDDRAAGADIPINLDIPVDGTIMAFESDAPKVRAPRGSGVEAYSRSESFEINLSAQAR